VVAASQSLGVDQAEFQRCAAMGTMQLQQADDAAAVAEHHQVLAQDLDPMGQVAQIVGEADRLPEAAHVFAARRIGPDMREFCILAGCIAMKVGTISRLQKSGSRGHGSPPWCLEDGGVALRSDYRARRSRCI
jgi:hypothetical protein